MKPGERPRVASLFAIALHSAKLGDGASPRILRGEPSAFERFRMQLDMKPDLVVHFPIERAPVDPGADESHQVAR